MAVSDALNEMTTPRASQSGFPSDQAASTMTSGASSKSPSGHATPDAFAAYRSLVSALTDPESDLPERDPRLFAIGMEMESLAAIYGDDHVRLHGPGLTFSAGSSEFGGPSRHGASSTASTGADATAQLVAELAAVALSERLQYEVVLPLFPSHPTITADEASIRLLVSLPHTYPDSSAPSIQLLGRYLGRFAVDAQLFGELSRIYDSAAGNSITFVPGDVCVFDGIELALERARGWYTQRLADGKEGEVRRERERQRGLEGRSFGDLLEPGGAADDYFAAADNHDARPDAIPGFDRSYSGEDGTIAGGAQTPGGVAAREAQLEIYTSEPIVVSRSVFVGHACRVTDPLEVPLVVHRLLSDKKIAKAAHPVMHAYRIAKAPERAGQAKVIISDNDDDGETAAGGRLQHLLQILVSLTVVARASTSLTIRPCDRS